MKDSLFELLINLFEKSLAQLKERNRNAAVDPYDVSNGETVTENLIFKAARGTSMRVFTDDEKQKLTKASYQLLTRLLLWNIVDAKDVELVINQLLFSESRFISLHETKWTVRNTLSEVLDTAQLAFLDLMLYPLKEDSLLLH